MSRLHFPNESPPNDTHPSNQKPAVHKQYQHTRRATSTCFRSTSSRTCDSALSPLVALPVCFLHHTFSHTSNTVFDSSSKAHTHIRSMQPEHSIASQATATSPAGGTLVKTVRVFITTRDLPETNRPKYVAVYTDAHDRPPKVNNRVAANNNTNNVGDASRTNNPVRVPPPRTLSEPRHVGMRQHQRASRTPESTTPSSQHSSVTRALSTGQTTTTDQQLMFARKHRSAPLETEPANPVHPHSHDTTSRARKHRSAPDHNTKRSSTFAKSRSRGASDNSPSRSADELNPHATASLAPSNIPGLSADTHFLEINQPNWCRSAHVAGWARVGRTEIFRDSAPIIEYATSIILSAYPDKDRSLYLCVYSVPRKPTMSHSLLVFGYIKLSQVTAASGSRVVIPVSAPTRVDEKTGKPVETKLKSTAALLVCAEPCSVQPQIRYTLGVTANYIERSKSLGRSSTVNRTFYTLHLQISADDCPSPLDQSACNASTEQFANEADQQPGTCASSTPHSSAPAMQSDAYQEQTRGKVRRRRKYRRKKDADPSKAVHVPANGINAPDIDNDDAMTQSDLSPPVALKAAAETSRSPFRRRKSDRDEERDCWTLVFRSACVERINRKASGGTRDINYFSTKPLISIPGATITDPDNRPAELSALDKIGRKLGVKHDKSQLFSLPNATFLSASADQKIMLSFFEDKKFPIGDGHSNGSHKLIAFATFTMNDLRKSELGRTIPFLAYGKEGLRKVGSACLVQVEHCEDPRFFGLRATLPEL